MAKRRIDNRPPDGWVTKLRAIFGISDDATWEDVLIECAQTKRHADRATREWMASQATPRLPWDVCRKCRLENGRWILCKKHQPQLAASPSGEER